MERRQEKRIDIDSLILPFIGSREDESSYFQYLLIDISLNGVKITIPKWLVRKDRLKKNDVINLHIPFQLGDKTYCRGSVAWISWDSTSEAQLCGIRIKKSAPLCYPIYISLQTSRIGIDLSEFDSVGDLLIKVLKDSSLVKKGVFVYLKHLIPYFSRIGNYPDKEYPQLKEFFLEDIQTRVKENQKRIEALYEKGVREQWRHTDIPKHLDLEELREFVESEINMDLMKSVFDSDAVLQYLHAITQLEKKLYSNYNTIVILYIQSLTQTEKTGS